MCSAEGNAPTPSDGSSNGPTAPPTVPPIASLNVSGSNPLGYESINDRRTPPIPIRGTFLFVPRNAPRMSFDPDAVETITVDSYGTLVDPSAAVDALDDHVEATESISDVWRTKSIEYTMIGNFVDGYQPFYAMNRDALRYALAAHDVDLPEDTVEGILSVYHELEVFEDVRDGIGRLVDGGYPVYVLSNGNPEMLESMIDHADIGDLISGYISAHEVGTFKPDRELYRHAAARTGTPIASIAHVAGPSFDIQGSKHAGMQGVWLDRSGGPWDTYGAEPDLHVGSFYEFADALGV